MLYHTNSYLSRSMLGIFLVESYVKCYPNLASIFVWHYVDIFQSGLLEVFNCSWTKFIAIIVNVRVFFMQNFRLKILTFRVTLTSLTFCVSRDLKFSLNHYFKLLNSIGGNLILKVKWKVRQN